MDCHYHHLVVVMKTGWLGKIMEPLTAAWIGLPCKKQQRKRDILKESQVPDGMKMPAGKSMVLQMHLSAQKLNRCCF
jgi:hypothetical protein